MPREPSPAFQFYFKDWRSSKKVSRMSFKERGMYLEMLIDEWDKGPLPTEPAAIAVLIGAKVSEFLKSWPVLKLCFVNEDDRGWTNPRLEAERLKQMSYRQRLSEEGKAGAAKRWGGHRVPIPPHYTPDAISLSSSIAIASSSAMAPMAKPSDATQQKAIVEKEFADRGARLVECYQRLYQIHRKGAHYRPRPNLDWLDACDLCRHWDDARLEKLAVLVLTTDDDWIGRTDRSFKIFAMKASWADDRLSAWEARQQVAT